jgi:hypothetical protein
MTVHSVAGVGLDATAGGSRGNGETASMRPRHGLALATPAIQVNSGMTDRSFFAIWSRHMSGAIAVIG